jgi:hypothetical protein
MTLTNGNRRPFTHVTVPEAGDRRRRMGIRCHVGAEHDVVEIGGVRVSGPHQMFLELGSVLSLVDLVVVGDALVRMGKATPESLVAASEASPSDMPQPRCGRRGR